MNMLFEGLKEKGALVIVPSSAVDTMNLGGLSGVVSLALQERSRNSKEASWSSPEESRRMPSNDAT
jgi:hypothetical protein